MKLPYNYNYILATICILGWFYVLSQFQSDNDKIFIEEIKTKSSWLDTQIKEMGTGLKSMLTIPSHN